MNTAFQMLLSIPVLRQNYRNLDHSNACNENCIACIFEKLAKFHLENPNKFISVQPIARKFATVCPTYNYGDHHDASEVINMIMLKFDDFEPYKNIFETEIKVESMDRIICTQCNNTFDRPIKDLVYDAQTSTNIFEPIRESIQDYKCSVCNISAGILNYEDDGIVPGVTAIKTLAQKTRFVSKLNNFSLIQLKRGDRFGNKTHIPMSFQNPLECLNKKCHTISWNQHYGQNWNAGHWTTYVLKDQTFFLLDDHRKIPSTKKGITNNTESCFLVLKNENF